MSDEGEVAALRAAILKLAGLHAMNAHYSTVALKIALADESAIEVKEGLFDELEESLHRINLRIQAALEAVGISVGEDEI